MHMSILGRITSTYKMFNRLVSPHTHTHTHTHTHISVVVKCC